MSCTGSAATTQVSQKTPFLGHGASKQKSVFKKALAREGRCFLCNCDCMDDRAIRSPDFKPVQLGKRGRDRPGSCGSKFPRLEPAAQTAQTSDIATSPGEPHADAVDERCAATQLSEARARDTCETRTSCLSVPERGIQPTTKNEVFSNRPGGELEKRPIIHHLHLLRCA